MRTMYDAVTAANIPREARMVAGYIDKIRLEPWSAADWARSISSIRSRATRSVSASIFPVDSRIAIRSSGIMMA